MQRHEENGRVDAERSHRRGNDEHSNGGRLERAEVDERWLWGANMCFLFFYLPLKDRKGGLLKVRI